MRTIRPFKRFLPFYVSEFVEMKKIYLVSQTYDRHIDHVQEGFRKGMLISDYDDLGLAKQHLSALKKASDPLAAIINLTNEKHLTAFKKVLSIHSEYAVYWAAVKSKQLLEKQVNAHFKDHIRRYISAHTKWLIARDSGVNPKLQVIFGELFVILRHRGEELRIKFKDIENS